MFADIGLHVQTVRTWVKEGLKTIDKGKPALIYGFDLIQFLKARNTKNKCATDFDQLFCMNCKDARHVYQNKIMVAQKGRVLQVHGLCRVCKRKMFQSYKLEALPQLRKSFKLVEALELYDCPVPTDKTQIPMIDEKRISESAQRSLFPQ